MNGKDPGRQRGKNDKEPVPPGEIVACKAENKIRAEGAKGGYGNEVVTGKRVPIAPRTKHNDQPLPARSK